MAPHDKSRRTEVTYKWKVWIDNGEAWDRNHIDPPYEEVQSTSPQRAAEEVWAERASKGMNMYGQETYIVQAVGAERPFWKVLIEGRPTVVESSATTLAELCDEPEPVLDTITSSVPWPDETVDGRKGAP